MEQYKISIKRCDSPQSLPYWQSFNYEGNETDTVSMVLEYLNKLDKLVDINGKEASNPIDWDCSCFQGSCGACSMVINNVPALACKTKLGSFKTKEIKLEPLSKFPLIKDLSVNREMLHSVPIALGIINSENAQSDSKNYDILYESAKCLKCGLCVEVCPNTGLNSKFQGVYISNDCLLEFRQADTKEHKKEIKKIYNKSVQNHCSKSFGCQQVCPAGIDFKKLLNKMNRF